MDWRIRIHTKMSWIRNTAHRYLIHRHKKIFFQWGCPIWHGYKRKIRMLSVETRSQVSIAKKGIRIVKDHGVRRRPCFERRCRVHPSCWGQWRAARRWPWRRAAHQLYSAAASSDPPSHTPRHTHTLLMHIGQETKTTTQDNCDFQCTLKSLKRKKKLAYGSRNISSDRIRYPAI